MPRLLARPDAVPAADEVIWQNPADHPPMPSVGDTIARPDETAAVLVLLDPDVGPISALSARRLSDAGLIDALVASEKLLAAVTAKQQEFLAEIAHRDPEGDEFLADEVGCALKVAPATAVQKLDDAVQLCGRLFDTNELVAAGVLSPANAPDPRPRHPGPARWHRRQGPGPYSAARV